MDIEERDAAETLKELLDAAGDFVVLLAENVRVEDTRRGVERVNSRIKTELCDLTRKNRRRIEVGECARRSRVGEVISRDIDCLDRRDGALFVEVMRSCRAPMSVVSVG